MLRSCMLLRGDVQRLKVRSKNAVKHKVQPLRVGAKLLSALLQLAAKLTGGGITFIRQDIVASGMKCAFTKAHPHSIAAANYDVVTRQVVKPANAVRMHILKNRSKLLANKMQRAPFQQDFHLCLGTNDA